MRKKSQSGQLELDENQELREPSAMYARNTEIPTFFGQPLLKGTFTQVDESQLKPDTPIKHYQHPHGETRCGDSIAWLRSLKSEATDLIFANPTSQIKKADWDTF